MADFDSDDQRRAFFGKLAAGTLGMRKAKAPKSLAAMRGKFIGDSGYRGSDTQGRIGATVTQRRDDTLRAMIAHQREQPGSQTRKIARDTARNDEWAVKARASLKDYASKQGKLRREFKKAEAAAKTIEDMRYSRAVSKRTGWGVLAGH